VRRFTVTETNDLWLDACIGTARGYSAEITRTAKEILLSCRPHMEDKQRENDSGSPVGSGCGVSRESDWRCRLASMRRRSRR
jgi:hypothetical protein